MKTIKSLLSLPTPKELGWSDGDSLGMRDFPNNDGGKTWEDYEEHCKKNYPIRFFLNDWVPYTILHPIKRLFGDAWYWIRCHTYTRYHMLDLRQPKYRNGQKNQDQYTYGWNDVDHKMLFACFNLLVQFVEGEDKWCPTEEDIAKELQNEGERFANSLRVQRDNMMEVRALYNYWTKERNELATKKDRALTAWCDSAVKMKTRDGELWKELNALEEVFDKQEDEMLLRLMKVRRFLWS